MGHAMSHRMHPEAHTFPKDRPNISQFKRKNLWDVATAWVYHNTGLGQRPEFGDVDGLRASKDAFTFVSDRIFSFETCIGRIDRIGDTERFVALLSSTSYSNITAGHIGRAWRAIHYANNRINPQIVDFRVPDVHADTEARHERNMLYLERMYRTAVNAIQKYPVNKQGETTPPSWKLSVAVTCANEARRYAETFGLPLSNYGDMDTDIKTAVKLWKARRVAYWSPSEVERRSKAGAKKRLMRLVNDE